MLAIFLNASRLMHRIDRVFGGVLCGILTNLKWLSRLVTRNPLD